MNLFLEEIKETIEKEQLRAKVVRSVEVQSLPKKSPLETVKRMADIIGASVSLIVLIPVLLLCALAVGLSSKGPIIYAQTRTGKGGRPFRMFKFRSMVDDAEESGPMWSKGPDDPRVTKVGRILRRTHLDELPQLWNVLSGDMSLVGPRPERPEFTTEFSYRIPRYPRRHAVKSGMTGLALVYYRYDASMDDVRRKLRYDLLYLKRQSLFLDLWIAFRTFANLGRRRGWKGRGFKFCSIE